VNGGSVSRIRVSDISRLTQSGGEITLGLETYDAARARLQGGDVGPIASFATSDVSLAGSLASSWTLNDSSTGLLTGAAETGIDLDLLDTSFLRIAGSDFAVDGAPQTPLPAVVSAATGSLTGTLASGAALDAAFTRATGAEIHLLDGSALQARRSFVLVGDGGNAADDTGFGAVASAYRIAQTEVTNSEYAEFLRSVARNGDPHALWDGEMADDPSGGIVRSGASSNYQYAVVSGRGDWPVVFVSRDDALRYVNWLHNGRLQDPLSTESGVYTFTGGVYDEMAGRAPGARFFLPTRDEWYKAAYYDPGTQSYFDYPTSSDTAPDNPPPTRELGNAANTNDALANDEAPLSDVGAYAFSASPNGSLDQAGNVLEWLEDSTALFGSHWSSTAANAAAGATLDVATPDAQEDFLGFRVPEPSSGAIALAALATLAALRRRSAR
jgi:sulfatase modifying factor 1